MQDDEYLASLQADREKELLEQAAREAAMEEERHKEEEALRKLEQEQVIAHWNLTIVNDCTIVMLYKVHQNDTGYRIF